MAGIYAPIKSMVSSPMGTASVQSLPRAGLLFDIPNRYPFVDRVGKHDGPPQLMQYASVASGTVTLYHASIVGTETITHSGTAAVSAVAGGITIGVGTAWEIRDSADHHWSHCAALSTSSVVMWDVSGIGDHLVAEGLSEAVVTSLCSTSRDLAVGTDWLDRGFTIIGSDDYASIDIYMQRPITSSLVVPVAADGSACAYRFNG